MINRLKITPKLTLILILFSIFLVAAIGLVNYISRRALLERDALVNVSAIAIEKEAALTGWLAEQRDLVATIAADPDMTTLMSRLLAAEPGSALEQSVKNELFNQLHPWSQGTGHLIGLLIMHPVTGEVLVASNSHEEGKFKEQFPYFLEGAKGPYVQTAYWSMELQSEAMTASAPVYSIDGRLLGVLAGRLNMEDLSQIIQRRAGLHQTDDAFLVNASSLFVTQPRLQSDKAVLRVGVHSEAARQCLTGKSGSIMAADYRGIPAIIAFRWLPQYKLCLISKLDQTEALLPLNELIRLIGLVSGLAILAGSGVAFLLARKITGPVHAIQTATMQFASGNLKVRLQGNAKDEIGDLEREFNQMADSLALKEASLQEYAGELEQKVNERTMALKVSEEHYRLLFNQILYGFSLHEVICDDNGQPYDYRFLEVNPAFEQLTGLQASAIIGRTVLEVLPDTESYWIEQYGRVALTGEPIQFENYAQAFGKYYDVTAYCPKLGQFAVIFMDVTERKRTEKALLQSEEQFRELIEQAADGIFISDRSGKYVVVNSKGCSMLGYSLEELLEKNLSDLLPAEDKGKNPPRLEDLRAGKVIISERRMVCKDGSILPVEISGKMLADGRFQGIVRDITDRKRSEDALKNYSRRLAVINRLDHVISSSLNLDTVYDAFVIEMKELAAFDRTAIVLFDDGCENWQILRQWTLGEPAFLPIEWHSIRGLALEWVVQHQQAYLEETLGEKTEWPEHQGLRREGLQSRVLLPLIIQGKVIGLLTLASRKPKAYLQNDLELLQTLADQLAIAVQNANLYEQAQLTAEELEQRVQARTAQLEKANKDLESFSYSVSHDLRAPLRAINGFAQILTEFHKENLDDEGKHYLDNVVEASNRMGVLIDDLLQYSRVGRASVHRQPVSLDDLFARILGDLSTRIAETGAIVDLPPAEKMPRILSDQTILGQIFSNIIGNALVYHRPHVSPIIRVTYQVDVDHHLFGISDNGIGIPAEHLDKIFNVFQRLHSPEDYPGTGIGLAIVKKSAELLSGQVWAESTVGAGSTFWIQIPKE